MDIELVHPELRPALARLPTLDPSKRLVRILGRLGPRLRRSPRVPGVSVRWIRAGRLRLRLYEPESRTGGIGMLWIHGGGLVFGSACQDDRLCSETAGELGITIVSVEYRLAPEAPFPAALDDATAAWDWIGQHGATLGIDPTRVFLAGESAGGGIAASLAQRLHDTAERQPVGQWLFAPMLDDRTASRSELDVIDHPVWNNSANRFGWASYLGVAGGCAVAPEYAVPARRTDLTGLAPVWLCTGDIELFHDEIADYARRLAEAGVLVELEVVEGAAHGFENWAGSTDLAEKLVRRARHWLATTLAIER